MQEILLNIESKETRCAHLKNGTLYDLVIERKKNRQLTGNIYRGKVKNILHNIQSAFIDINEGENGFIHISDILENTQKFQEMFEMDFDWDIAQSSSKKRKETDISKILKIDQPVLVQVVKEPIGSKGARLTSNVSIAGRYLVLLPNTAHRGVSRKIEDAASREKLKKLIRAFEMPQDMGLICRTASMNATTDMLIEEANELLKSWQGIVEDFQKSTKPNCLYEESDLIKRAILTAVDKKFERVLIDDYATYQRCKRLYSKYCSEHPLKIELYRDKSPMFERFNIEREIDRALRRKIWLSSGGYLFFDRTEAMYTIDVNSGRSNQQSSTSTVEEALVQINMEAAEEIARQLRIRNIGGLVICDFIDMRARKNQRRVLDRLKEAMKDDTAKCTNCPYCNGSGLIKSHESVAIEIERSIKKLITQQQHFGLDLVSHPDLDHYLGHHDKDYFTKVAEKWNAQIRFDIDDNLHLNEFQFYSSLNGKKLDT
ncbi:MAG: Rne/Rng family ribonuclease [Chlamydiales bacterium]|nr:Rne/Rng family ribonuclease [Chlamydiales bacterium]